jgi:hypothetical protein
MLGLKLRDEFLGTHMPGTAIALRTSDNQGAVQKSADEILSITYPTADVQTALKAISVKRRGCPIVLMGDRGRGKSHIMAVMHHAIQSPERVETWLKEWGTYTGNAELENFELVKGFFPISEPIHNHEYFFLWDLLFDQHPKGEYYRGQFESMKNSFPPRSLVEKMFEENPTCLILDEFQTWYTGLPDKDPKTGLLLKQYAFNFIQILSEIAQQQPYKLIFIISVLNNQNDAFQQVHRQSPVIIDFRGPSAKQDRQKLLLHRLFINRRNIIDSEIINLAAPYASERFRLLHPNKTEVEKERVQQEAYACWPFSPELLELLEDHILLSSAAQETRDMIQILAQVYKSRGDSVPFITPADFFVDGESDEVQTLVDSISVQAGQEKIREIAQRNLESVRDSGVNVPDARELISTIWMRSLSPGKTAGGTPAELHLDITRSTAIDDNAFQVELALLIENSINIHGDEVPGGPLWIGMSENPRSKVRACAKNNKLWDIGAVSTAGMTVYPCKDINHIKNTLKHIFVTGTAQTLSRIIILGSNWKREPWSEVDDVDQPSKWDRPVLLVIPDQIEGDKADISAYLGAWLAKHVQKRRNTIRFLLLGADTQGIYVDEELIYSARCSFLCSPEGWGSDMVYKSLWQDFDRPLRTALRSRFNRVAILRKWDFQQPQNCVFDIEKISGQGAEIPAAVEAKLLADLFDRNDFQNFVLQRAKDSDVVGSLMDDLIEPPPPNGEEAIPFLGENKIYEFILEFAADGDIVLNVGGSWIGRRIEDTSIEDALRFIQGKAFRTGQEMRQIQLGLPGAIGGGTVVAPNTATITRQSGSVTATPWGTNDNGSTLAISDQIGDNSAYSGNVGLTPTAIIANTKSKKSGEPATGINLSGCFETWGIASNQAIDTAQIEFAGLTAQQIKQILLRIPSTFKASLNITYKEGGQE